MYKELDDNELLYMVNDSTDNYDYLFLKYKPIVFNICKEYEIKGKELGYELDDLIQIAYLGLFNAIKSYKEKKKVLFYTYMTKCIRNSLNNEFRNQLTNKKVLLNIALSYDIPISNDRRTIIELIPNKSSPDPVKFLLDEMEEIAYTKFLNSLPIETAVTFEMKNQDIKENDIARFLGKDEKTIKRYLRDAKKAYDKARLKFQAL